MTKLIKVGNSDNIAIFHYRCDTELDMNNIDTSQTPIGSDCYVINAGTFYVLNSKKVWKQKVEVSFTTTDIDIIDGGNGDG